MGGRYGSVYRGGCSPRKAVAVGSLLLLAALRLCVGRFVAGVPRACMRAHAPWATQGADRVPWGTSPLQLLLHCPSDQSGTCHCMYQASLIAQQAQHYTRAAGGREPAIVACTCVVHSTQSRFWPADGQHTARAAASPLRHPQAADPEKVIHQQLAVPLPCWVTPHTRLAGREPKQGGTRAMVLSVCACSHVQCGTLSRCTCCAATAPAPCTAGFMLCCSTQHSSNVMAHEQQLLVSGLLGGCPLWCE